MSVTHYIPEATLVRAIIISKESDSLRQIIGRIHYQRLSEYAIKLIGPDLNCLCTLDLNFMSEYHIAPALEGQPLFIDLRIDPDLLVSLSPVYPHQGLSPS